MLATSTLSLLFAGLAMASPVQKRQDMSSSLPNVDPLSTIASIAAPSVSAPSAPISSLVSMAMPSASASASASGTETYPAYPCPDGYLLTYVNVQQTYDYPVATLLTYTADWQNATYMGYINGTGGNTVGATRFIGGDMPKEEVLSEYFTLRENVALQIVMNLTSGPIMAPNGAQLSNYSTTLQVYNNNTASTVDDGATTVKLFCNFCAADQELGQAAVRNNFMGALDNLAVLATGAPLDSSSPAASMSMSAMSSAMSSAMPSAMPSASMSSDSALPVQSIVSEVVPTIPSGPILSSAAARA